MKITKQSNMSPRDRASAALLRVNSTPVVRPTTTVDTEAVAAAADQARADRLKANAARHVESARVIDEVMDNMTSKEQQAVTRRAMLNPAYTPEQLDSGEAYSDELEKFRNEQN
jgi:hypothetical protein